MGTVTFKMTHTRNRAKLAPQYQNPKTGEIVKWPVTKPVYGPNNEKVGDQPQKVLLTQADIVIHDTTAEGKAKIEFLKNHPRNPESPLFYPEKRQPGESLEGYEARKVREKKMGMFVLYDPEKIARRQVLEKDKALRAQIRMDEVVAIETTTAKGNSTDPKINIKKPELFDSLAILAKVDSEASAWSKLAAIHRLREGDVDTFLSVFEESGRDKIRLQELLDKNILIKKGKVVWFEGERLGGESSALAIISGANKSNSAVNIRAGIKTKEANMSADS